MSRMGKNTKEKYKIEVVEDDEIISKSITGELESAGFEVIKAANGEAGLALALKDKPDLILLDIVMPIMDGLTMLRKLRQDSWGGKVPVIILTNLSTDEYLMDNALKLDPSHYLTKTDWTLEEVVEKIKKRLEE